jgi:leucyl aminopeptidase
MNALVLALAMVTGGSAHPSATDEVWITIDREVLIAFETGAEPAVAAAMDAIEDPLSMRPDVIPAVMSEERLAELSAFIHERYRRCGGFVWHASREEAHEAAARAAGIRDLERTPAPVPYTIDNAPTAYGLMAGIRESNIRETITRLSTDFFTRYHNCPSGLQSAQWIHALWSGYAVGRPDVSVQFFNHTTYTTLQPSVILTIQGTTTPSEVVVLGGHQDSIAGTNCSTSRSPGADDDASGIAVLSEIIRVAMATGYQPQKTVKFMAYAAEEVGLRGSGEIALQHQQQGINVIGVLQYDMTNYSESAGKDIVFIQDFTHFFQNEFVEDLAERYVPYGGTDPSRDVSLCNYGCSDHASWTNRGFAATFPFESRFGDHNPEIHRSTDTLSFMGGTAQRSVPFAQLGAAYIAELAKGGFTARPEKAAAEKKPAKRRLRGAARQGRRS